MTAFDFTAGLNGPFTEFARRKRIVRINYIYQMMPNRSTDIFIGLTTADIQITVDLYRIRRYDFKRIPRQIQRKLCFPDRRGANQYKRFYRLFPDN